MDKKAYIADKKHIADPELLDKNSFTSLDRKTFINIMYHCQNCSSIPYFVKFISISITLKFIIYGPNISDFFYFGKSRVEVLILIITCTKKKLPYLTLNHKSITTYCTKSIDSKSNLTKNHR